MKKALICSIDNENIKNFQPIISRGKDKFDFTIFDLSNLHKNKINYDNHSYKTIFSKIKVSKPFYLLGIIKRLYVTFLFVNELNKIKDSFDIIICGRVGILEYYLIKHFKKINNCKAFSVNDSILIYNEQSSFFKKIRLAVYGFNIRQNICDKIFVSGQVSKETLIKDGVTKQKIVVTGLPRFKKYFLSKKILKNDSECKNVLILTGAHKWNGYHSWQKDQEKFLKTINQISKGAYEINIKPHPRDTFDFTRLKNLNILSKKSDIDEEIINNDIIISVTSISTGLIQAGWLSKKILFIKSRNLSYLMDSFSNFILEFPTVELKDFKIDSLFKARKPNSKILDMYISKKSLDSPKLIINEINK